MEMHFNTSLGISQKKRQTFSRELVTKHILNVRLTLGFYADEQGKPYTLYAEEATLYDVGLTLMSLLAHV